MFAGSQGIMWWARLGKSNERIMKKLLFILLSFPALITVAQNTEKPRYLRHATPLCPIDISKWGSKDGLIKGNSQTVGIDTTTVLVVAKTDVKDDKDSVVIKAGQKFGEKRYDTVIKRSILIEAGQAFEIVYEIGNFSIIKFWPVKGQKNKGLISYLLKDANQSDGARAPLDSLEYLEIKGLRAVTPKVNKPNKDSTVYDLSRTYYLVSTQLILSQSKEFDNKNNTWNIGLLALPVKLRPFATEPGQFDFTDGFSVGTTFSWTIHHNWRTGFTHNLLLYAGLSSYTADSSKIREKREDYKIAAFSPAIGWMWEKNGVQLSLLTGFDFPAGSIQQKWVYRNKPWIGIGLGLSLFKISNSESTGKGENK